MPEPQVYRNAFGGIVQRYFDAEGNPIGDPASLDDQVGAVFQDSSGNWYKKGANGINIPLPGPPGSGETSEDFNVQLPPESNAAAMSIFSAFEPSSKAGEPLGLAQLRIPRQ